MPPRVVEQIKLIANTINAVGLAILGFGLLRPIFEEDVQWSVDAIFFTFIVAAILHVVALAALDLIR